MRERGYKGKVDAKYASFTVGTRVILVRYYPQAAYDPSPTVRTARAASDALTPDDEAVLASDDHPGVRVALVGNPRCSVGSLHRLSADRDLRVREAVAQHPAAHPTTLAILASSLHRRRGLTLARHLASNPHTPDDALERWIAYGTASQARLAREALAGRGQPHGAGPAPEGANVR